VLHAWRPAVLAASDSPRSHQVERMREEQDRAEAAAIMQMRDYMRSRGLVLLL